jgi:glycerol-3-phosphate acyltransferase PlsY
MHHLLLALAGYLWGGIPTADYLARLRGIELRDAGSRNPGANNARRLGGAGLGAAVLALEMVKGALAAGAGWAMAGDAGATMTGLAAIAGNIYNPYFRGRGGKGLGITAGVTLVAWPTGLLLVVTVLAFGLAVFRVSGKATLLALGTYVLGASLWTWWGLPTAWGLEPALPLVGLAVGATALVAPKALVDAIRPMSTV